MKCGLRYLVVRFAALVVHDLSPHFPEETESSYDFPKRMVQLNYYSPPEILRTGIEQSMNR
jgi:hypothetical protein